MDIKKYYIYTISFLSVFLIKIILLIITITSIYNSLIIKNVKLENYDEKHNTITLKLSLKKNKLNNEFNCNAMYDNKIITNKGVNNNCYLILKLNNDYRIYLSNNIGYKSKIYKITDFIDNVLDFKFNNETIYLVPNETYTIKYIDKLIDNRTMSYIFSSSDNNVATVKDNVITAVGPGEIKIKSNLSDDFMNVIVTDLITKPSLPSEYKEHVPCNLYTNKDNALLDKILAYKINEAGYKTRGAVIAAARFLTLEFKYRVPYFYENGRIHSSGVHWVDGEGRYYHAGLYLSEGKMNTISSTWRGPSIWGCPLTNLEDAPTYGYYPGVKMPNGLDCSGFVSWALKNAGFDPGDIGAGESDYPYQMTDLGEYTKITDSLINSGKVKVGDLINFWGHIAIIIGIDDDNYYVAESLQYFGGVVPKVYKKNKVADTFTHIVLMDSYYQNDGTYTNMW